MKQGDIITLVAVLGGGYAAYWYMTNYGPNGAVHNAAGAKVGMSYWDSWFGSSTPATQIPAVQPMTNQLLPGSATIAPAPLNPPPPVNTTPSAPPTAVTTNPVTNTPVDTQAVNANLTALTNALITASNGNSQSQMNADNWSFFLSQIRGQALSAEDFHIAFPFITDTNRGFNMTAQQFATAVLGALGPGMASGPGISGIGAQVRVPSMSFGSNRGGGTPVLSAMRSRKGGYIQ